MRSTLTGLIAVLCVLPAICRAQDSPDGSVDLTTKIANFPTKVFQNINKRTTDLQRKLDERTEKYLMRMAAKEEKMRARLYRTDSAKALALYPENPRQKYAGLLQKYQQDSGRVCTSMGPEYLPHVDSLQGALGFLNKNPNLLNANPALQARMQASLANVQNLEGRLQAADVIKQYVQSRKAQLQQAFSASGHIPAGMGNALSGYNKEAYYYADQVRSYRAILNDPDKIMQTAMAMLDRVPAFTSFMQKNSFLASLFGVPAGYGSDQALTGLQTRDQINALIMSQAGQGGSAGASAIQSSLQSAQNGINQLHDKLSSLGGGSGDMDMPDFKPNNLRSKTFFRRLEYGTYFQTTPATTLYPSYTDLGLSLTYKLGHGNSIGIRGSYKLGWGTPIQHVALSSQGAGLGSFVNIQLKKSFSITGGYELNYLTPFASLQDIRSLSRWTPSGLIGITKTVSFKSAVFKKTQVSLLWDFLSYEQSPKTQPLVFRVGYSF